MVRDSARTATAKMKIVTTAKEVATATSATVLALKADTMTDNGDPDNVKERVTRLLDMRKEQIDVAQNVEYQIMKALYDLRGAVRIEDMVAWTRWSRQTIYNKWSKHGFEVK